MQDVEINKSTNTYANSYKNEFQEEIEKMQEHINLHRNSKTEEDQKVKMDLIQKGPQGRYS
jgi:hypothetical protein